jgi:hypothetical protein
MSEFDYSIFGVDAYITHCDEVWARELIKNGEQLKIGKPIEVLARTWQMASAVAGFPTNVLEQVEGKEKIWERMCENEGARQAIYHAQSGALVLFFTAFEVFMRQSIFATVGKSRDEAAEEYPDFQTAFSATFGDELLHRCWHAPAVQFFMDVRDAIIEHGSSTAPLLTGQRHDITIHDGILKITHNDNMRLLASLMPIVEEFIASPIHQIGGNR